MAASHPIGVITHKKSDRGDAARNDAAAALAVLVEHRGMRRQSAPSDYSAKAKIVERGWIVIGDAALENFSFPAIGRRFVALQLAQNFKQSVFPESKRPGSDMLPSRRIFHGLALDTVTVIYHWSARTEVAE